jgi:chitinase
LAFCRFNDQGKLPIGTLNPQHVSDRVVDGLKRRVFHYTAETTRSKVIIEFDANVRDPDGVAGLHDNPCWPKNLVEDPGFALLTDDPYYGGHVAEANYGRRNYKDLVPHDVLDAAAAEGHFSQDGYRKRDKDLHNLDPDAWVYNDGNCTRRLTDAELEEKLGILRCSSTDCKEEMQALGIETAMVVQPTATAPFLQTAVSMTQLTVGILATSSASIRPFTNRFSGSNSAPTKMP